MYSISFGILLLAMTVARRQHLQWKIWQSVATSAAFFASPRTDLSTKLYVLLVLLALSMAALLFAIFRRIGWRNAT
jgi:hypothetical protein